MLSRDLVPMVEECASLTGIGKPLQLAGWQGNGRYGTRLIAGCSRFLISNASTMLEQMQRVEIVDTIDAEHDGLSIDDEVALTKRPGH